MTIAGPDFWEFEEKSKEASLPKKKIGSSQEGDSALIAKITERRPEGKRKPPLKARGLIGKSSTRSNM